MSDHSSPSSGGLTGSCNCRCVDDSWKAYSVGEPACYPEVGCYRAYRNGGFSLASSCNHSSTCNCAENAYFHSATCYEAGCYSWTTFPAGQPLRVADCCQSSMRKNPQLLESGRADFNRRARRAPALCTISPGPPPLAAPARTNLVGTSRAECASGCHSAGGGGGPGRQRPSRWPSSRCRRERWPTRRSTANAQCAWRPLSRATRSRRCHAATSFTRVALIGGCSRSVRAAARATERCQPVLFVRPSRSADPRRRRDL